VGVGELVFIEVVNVGDAEVGRGEETNFFMRGFGEKVEGDEAGTEDEFFCYRPLVVLYSLEGKEVEYARLMGGRDKQRQSSSSRSNRRWSLELFDP